MTDETTGAPLAGGPAGAELTNAEKLTALTAYLKAMKPLEEHLRAATVADMQRNRAERVGAFMPDGEKIGAVGYNSGNRRTRVTDQAAAVAWCIQRYPDAIVKAINPAFLKAICEYSAKTGQVGEPGVDPKTGEVLDFLIVEQGNPFVTVTPTKEGVARMTALAHGFAGMLEGPAREPEAPTGKLPGWEKAEDAGVRQPGWPTHVRVTAEPDPYDPDFADRLANGAYDR